MLKAALGLVIYGLAQIPWHRLCWAWEAKEVGGGAERAEGA